MPRKCSDDLNKVSFSSVHVNHEREILHATRSTLYTPACPTRAVVGNSGAKKRRTRITMRTSDDQWRSQKF